MISKEKAICIFCGSKENLYALGAKNGVHYICEGCKDEMHKGLNNLQAEKIAAGVPTNCDR